MRVKRSTSILSEHPKNTSMRTRVVSTRSRERDNDVTTFCSSRNRIHVRVNTCLVYTGTRCNCGQGSVQDLPELLEHYVTFRFQKQGKRCPAPRTSGYLPNTTTNPIAETRRNSRREAPGGRRGPDIPCIVPGLVLLSLSLSTYLALELS